MSGRFFIYTGPADELEDGVFFELQAEVIDIGDALRFAERELRSGKAVQIEPSAGLADPIREAMHGADRSEERPS